MNGDAAKWSALARETAQDAFHPDVAALALALRALAGGNQHRIATLAHTIARDWIPYQTDTARVGVEDMAGVTRPREHPLAVLARKDDCDSKARLFVALCRAAGLRAELIPLWRGPVLQHVSARVWIDGQPRDVETILARATLGETHQDVPKEADGKWRHT